MNTPVSTPAESLYALGSSVQSGESAPSDASSHGESQQQNTSSDTEGASIAAHAAHWLGPLEASELDVADVEMFECIGNGSCGSVHRGRWMGAEVGHTHSLSLFLSLTGRVGVGVCAFVAHSCCASCW
jgi:hypothetical protein